MRRLLGIALTLALVSLQAFGALLYQQDFEGTFSRTTWPTSSRYYEPVDGLIMDKQLWCYTVGGIGGYDSWRSSTTYKKSGSKSIRNELNGMKKNLECGGTEEKSRQSMHVGADIQKLYIYANGQVPNRTNHGDERWFGISYYYPSNEGTISSWWSKDQYVNILQFMSSGNLTSVYQFIPEIFISLGNNGNVRVQNYVSTTTPTATVKTTYTTNTGRFTKDAWNDIVIHYKRNWTNDGSLTVWVNGVKAMERLNTPVAVRSAPSGYFDFGQYFGYSQTPSDGYRNQIYVQYFDSLKVGDNTSSYAEVDPSNSAPPPPPAEPDPVITTVNSGSAIASNALIPFVSASPGLSATSCEFNNDGNKRYVAWDYSTTDTGRFWSADVSGYTGQTAALKCDYQKYSYVAPLVISGDTYVWGESQSDVSVWSGNILGYTTGIKVVKEGSTEYSNATLYGGTPFSTATGDNIACEFTYSVGTDSEDDLYFAVIDASGGDKRLTAEGTAGSLTAGTLNGGIGVNRSATNSSLGQGVYRTTIGFTVGSRTTPEFYKYRIGTRGTELATHELRLHELVCRKNAVTKSATKNVSLAVTDTVKPILTNCGMSHVPNGEGGYNTNMSCTTNEIGGTAYAMITTTDTSPDEDDVIAGTGSPWAASVDASIIQFESTIFEYQDLWGWMVHVDDAGNKSLVASMTFDDGVIEGTAKKLIFAAPDTDIHCLSYSEELARFITTPFTGNLAIQVYDGDPRAVNLNEFPAKLAYDSSVAFTAGESSAMTEDSLESGSLNNLLLGDQGYYIYYTDGDECSNVAPVQVTAE